MTRHLATSEAFTDALLARGVQPGLVGQPLARLEGLDKVCGTAAYAYEHRLPEAPVYGCLVLSTIARGALLSIDRAAVLGMPGILEVIDAGERTPQHNALAMDDKPMQGNAALGHYGQPIALVVAQTLEQAAAGALALRSETREGAPPRWDLAAAADRASKPPPLLGPPDAIRGDVDTAMAQAPVTLDVTYTTPSQSSAAMEPHASIAVWSGDALTVYGSCQRLASNRGQLAQALGIEPEQVRIVSRFVGGGFGSKLGIAPDMTLAAIAARRLGRPVKVALTRDQVFQCTVRRTDTRQRVRLAADSEGRLSAIAHETLSGNCPGQSFWEPAGLATMALYAAEHRRITHRLAEVDLLIAGSMRAPGEAVGMLALENAMDEMAERLGLDPIEFRRRNEPARDPQQDIPFSSRQLLACFDEGARRFGWNARRASPRSRREGEWYVGIGCAAAARSNMLQKSEARVSITPGGRAVVETDMTDIGTGTYTILGQIAGHLLGLPLEQVDVHLGDTDLPRSSGSGGSAGAGSSGSSVLLACAELRELIAERLQVREQDLELRDGQAVVGARQVPLAALAASQGLHASGVIEPGDNAENFRQVAYGAHFCEVAVSAITGETRVRRMLGVFAAGRVLNAQTARSQCLGGMAWGIGAALMEELMLDPRFGNFVNHNLAEYHVPTNADVPQLEVVFLPERDDRSNPLMSKGIGELGISGAGAAVTNAIYNACGVRVRDYPLTLDKILAGLDTA